VHIRLHAVGRNMPKWVNEACDQYRVRLPREFKFAINEYSQVRAQSRTPSRNQRDCSDSGQKVTKGDASASVDSEGEKLLGALGKGDYVVALDVRGKSLTTASLASRLQQWQLDGRDVALLIGGPDGLSQAVLKRADFRWSLSDLTLPHPLVRVVLLEQLYRAHSILVNHPYHRE